MTERQSLFPALHRLVYEADDAEAAAELERVEKYVAAAETFRDSFTKPAPATYLAAMAMDEALR